MSNTGFDDDSDDSDETIERKGGEGCSAEEVVKSIVNIHAREDSDGSMLWAN
jgi:hypothetical protein